MSGSLGQNGEKKELRKRTHGLLKLESEARTKVVQDSETTTMGHIEMWREVEAPWPF